MTPKLKSCLQIVLEKIAIYIFLSYDVVNAKDLEKKLRTEVQEQKSWHTSQIKLVQIGMNQSILIKQ